MTPEEIQTHFPNLPIMEVYKKYGNKSLNEIDRMGIDGDEYNAFCALWRNMSVRFSEAHIRWEINPDMQMYIIIKQFKDAV